VAGGDTHTAGSYTFTPNSLMQRGACRQALREANENGLRLHGTEAESGVNFSVFMVKLKRKTFYD